jgi:hypothetical protein
MSEANKELVRRHVEEIWNRQDLAVADELMAEDYLEHAVAPFGQAEPGRVDGPAALRQTAQWLLAVLRDAVDLATGSGRHARGGCPGSALERARRRPARWPALPLG